MIGDSDLGDQITHTLILHQIVKICLFALELIVPVLYREESPLVKGTLNLEESKVIFWRLGWEEKSFSCSCEEHLQKNHFTCHIFLKLGNHCWYLKSLLMYYDILCCLEIFNILIVLQICLLSFWLLVYEFSCIYFYSPSLDN